MATQGTAPAITPNQKGVQLTASPGDSYFSWSRPNRIIEALAPARPTRAAMSAIPTSMAIRTTMTDDENEYSIQRA
jgi:hypothetical protein